MLLVVGLSMLAAPLVAHLGQRLGDWLELRTVVQQPLVETEFGDLRGHVIMAGYGRVGQMVGQLLQSQGVPFVAIESNASLLAQHRSSGARVVFGDASRPELLGKLHLISARAVVLTMDDTAAAVHAVHAIRQVAPDVHITARARDERHARTLLDAGATQVVPETLESSLKVADSVLRVMGVAPEVSDGLLAQERQRCLAAMREAQ
jgi:CPA2 family monovalent cation:H+ antiporter-2